jgi:hypothetical protein
MRQVSRIVGQTLPGGPRGLPPCDLTCEGIA